MWLGVTLDVRPSDTYNDIVTCGHLWKRQRCFNNKCNAEYLVNGVCYIIDGNLEKRSVAKLLPLVNDKSESKARKGFSVSHHIFGQAGMSAVFSEDGSELIIGSPGIDDSTGSIVQYTSNPDSYTSPIIPESLNEADFESYFGYSLTTGKFFDLQRTLYAVGAPRDGSGHGKVYIVKGLGARNSVLQQERNSLKGNQLGEYFGASVLGIDLNNDSFTDLLVGAPFHSLEPAGDQGKVYVYMSTGTALMKHETNVTGDNKEYARFGTALANLGDLDQDEYPDFAVGAPYEEGGGAIYIYHGSSSGVSSNYAQKIKAADVRSGLSAFGIHISRGFDIDKNGYPDILVGSYASSNAVLLRSRPVIFVKPELIFTPKQIILNHTECTSKNQTRTCVRVDACLQYNGKHAPPSLNFQVTLSILDLGQRGFFFPDNPSVTDSKLEMAVNVSQKTCLPFELNVKDVVKNMNTSIQVQLSHKLISTEDSNIRFDETFPIYHPSVIKSEIWHLSFQRGCGEDEECHSDLVISSEWIGLNDDAHIMRGTISTVSVAIHVRNLQEPAYNSLLLIVLPPDLPIVKKVGCVSVSQQHNASLVCDLGNLANGTQQRIEVKLDVTKIPLHTKHLEIGLRAVTESYEISPEDNERKLQIFLESSAMIGITDVSSFDQIMYNDTTESVPSINHTYMVKNHGPSPLQTIHILLHVPHVFWELEGQTPFLSATVLKTNSEIPVVCNKTLNGNVAQPSAKYRRGASSEHSHTTEGNRTISLPFASQKFKGGLADENERSDGQFTMPEKLIDGNKTESPKAHADFRISCDAENIECITYRCLAGPFLDVRKLAKISLNFQLDFSVLNNQLGRWSQIDFVTTGSILVTDNDTKIQRSPGVAEVTTVIIYNRPPESEKLSLWIPIGSAVIGLILLIIILIILIRVGFFKRKEKVRLIQMSRKEKKNKKTVDQDTDSIDFQLTEDNIPELTPDENRPE